MLDDKPEYDITVEDIDKIIEEEQKKIYTKQLQIGNI